MRSILVTGANGFVGQALCAELLHRKYVPRAVIRKAAMINAIGCEIIHVDDIAENTQWQQALDGIETVIHLAARVHVMQEDAADPLDAFRQINVVGTEHLARCAAASGVKRFVYVSSVKVNGEETEIGQMFVEGDTPSPQDPYGVSKYEAEQVLLRVAAETGLEVVIVRPPLIYGSGVKGNFAQMLKILRKGMPLPLATVKNLRSLLYVGNLVDALILCAEHPNAKGQTYLVSDGEDVSTSNLLRVLADVMGCSPLLFPCPSFLLKAVGSLIGKSAQMERLLGSLRIDNRKICQELGWTPPYSLRHGLRATVE